jgi:hypothetical protein
MPSPEFGGATPTTEEMELPPPLPAPAGNMPSPEFGGGDEPPIDGKDIYDFIHATMPPLESVLPNGQAEDELMPQILDFSTGSEADDESDEESLINAEPNPKRQRLE